MTTSNNIYMVGMGGIGMSALAQLLVHQGKNVSGSDREESPTTAMLGDRGIQVTVGHDQCNIPADTGLLIYSDAVNADNTERVRAREMGIKQISYFEMLGKISEPGTTIAVAGTHGKTTTTGMLASILRAAGKEPTAIVGSIVRDFPGRTGGSNFLAGRSDLYVIEACEYRDHLLELKPEILVITNIELDHTDFFPSLSAMQNTFHSAVERVPKHGTIVTDPENSNIAPILSHISARVVDYTKKAVGELKLIGEFNRENARAALAGALAAEPSLSQEAAIHTLSEFKGSWRRFEYKGETPHGALVYDDYAHHPTAVRKTIEAAREKYPNKRIVVAFHPHLYSRTKSFLAEFADALATADDAIIAPIYAAREAHDGSISSDVLAEEIRMRKGNARALQSFEAIRQALSLEPGNTVIITMGAGDIYKVSEQIIVQ
ncbi:MAG: Uncharacterized protein G01um10148_271 [Parcubacteria group bacterium Gr01-1014_8]|nr:MAG: Uncharacterized protein G01um10148_271 [Parcubacteria group bacterium Gr01-1014_8]